jgi:putative membrane protein
MTTELIIRYFHFLGIFFVFASLVAEHLLLRKSVTPDELKRVSTVDTIYGFSAVIVLTVRPVDVVASGKTTCILHRKRPLSR